VVGNSIRALGRLGAVLRDDELLAMLTDERPRVRQELVRALGESKDPRAVPHLAEFIEGEDPTLRTLAIQSLGKIGGDEARVLLENARSDPRSQGSQLVFLEQALAAYER
jgi:HEAT repeat protein